VGHRRGVTAPVVVIGRAVDAARQALFAAFGSRVRSAGADRTEALALDGATLTTDATVRMLGEQLHVRDVTAPQTATFEGFLDGIQRSATLAYLDGVPLVHGTAAAAIRERDRAGRMTTWRAPRIDHAVYASAAALGAFTWEQVATLLSGRGQTLRDTDDRIANDPRASRHPASLARTALDALARRRDDLERDIGREWCDAHASRALYVDGSLRTSSHMLRSTGVVGVIKSHARLYVPDDQLPVILALEAAQRSSVIVAVDDKQRDRFHTWYLRLRSAAGRDPFFGLIRVETGVRDGSEHDVEQSADRLSSWLLAERSPIARPDSRWDVMPYAIRNCEVYLRAVA